MNNIVRLRVFENRALRNTFGPKRKELPGGGGVEKTAQRGAA